MNNKNYRVSALVFIFLWLLALPLSAQEVSNIRAQQEGREIAVYYDLSERANVSLSVDVNGKRIKPTFLSGDFGKNVEAGERKRIAWQVLDENNGKFKAKDVVFSVRAHAPWRPFILAEGAISPKPFQYSAGLMVGVVSRAGIYLKARSSFQFASASGSITHSNNRYYVTSSDDILSDAEMPYYLSGNKKPMQWLINGGVIFRVANKPTFMCYLYTGVGYGIRQQLWETKEGAWLKYQPTTFEGFSGDLGCMMTYKHLAISAGVNTINFKYAEMQIGIGYIFK